MKVIKNSSLIKKIFWAIALTFFILGFAIYVFIYFSFPKRYMDNKKKNVEKQVENCLNELSDIEDIYGKTKEKLIQISGKEGVCIEVFCDGKSVYSINSNQIYSIGDLTEDTMVDVITVWEASEYEKTTIKCTNDSCKIIADIYIPLKIIDDIEGVLLSTYPVIIMITLIMTILLSIIAAKKISRPIVKIIDKVNDMSLFNHKPKKIDYTEEIKDEIIVLDERIENMYFMLNEVQLNMENELKGQMKQEKLKFDFLRMAAHELKTPLTAVNGMIEGMYYNISPYNDREKYLLECQKIIYDMNHLIKGMLLSTELSDMSNKTQIDIKDLIYKISDMFATNQIKNKIAVKIDIKSQFLVLANKEMLEGALKNIIHNSIMYCDTNGIIKIFIEQGKLHIFNSCTPLSDERINKIFEAFYRGDNSHENQNGNGLGLYLVKRTFDILNIEYKFARSCIENVYGMEFEIDLNNIKM